MHALERPEALRAAPAAPAASSAWSARPAAMRRLHGAIERVSRYKSNVLLLGESGTGKELVARALHDRGPRAAAPVRPGQLRDARRELLESELFGHERGAFTGADERKRGLFELADGGTLFLDEIGEMDASTQAKLLRVLERSEFRRVGGTEQGEGRRAHHRGDQPGPRRRDRARAGSARTSTTGSRS